MAYVVGQTVTIGEDDGARDYTVAEVDADGLPAKLRGTDGLHHVLGWDEEGVKVFGLAEPSEAFQQQAAAPRPPTTRERLAEVVAEAEQAQSLSEMKAALAKMARVLGGG